MKSYNQMSEDIESRRAQAKSTGADRASSFKSRSKAEMERNRGSSSTSGSKESGDNISKQLGRSFNKDVSRAAREKERNQSTRAPFKPKRASKGVPFRPKS